MARNTLNEIIEMSAAQEVEMGNDWFELISEDHFWIKWRFTVLLQVLTNMDFKGKVLEIGCGNAMVIKQLEEKLNWIIDGCDLNVEALANSLKVTGKIYQYDIHSLNPKLTGKYDMALLLDVVEHIKDDTAFLQVANKHLKSRGLILINVPALQSLYSLYDEAVGHFRRYDKASIRALCERSGLEVVHVQYWGMTMVPLLWVRKRYLRLVSRKVIIHQGFKPPAKWINTLLKWIGYLETQLIRNPPIGTSVLVLARVKG